MGHPFHRRVRLRTASTHSAQPHAPRPPKPPRHPRSVRTLPNVFQHLVEQGATVVATEHDLDFKQPPKPRQAQAAPPRTQCSKP